jgi:ABC-2 type transport system ATP-binding protein
MTAEGLIAYVKPLYPTWDEALRRKLQADLGLTEHAPLRSLSRGTRMKAALLSSLAYRPHVLILDEPFTGLDPLVRDELIRALLELASEHPCTVLISSHDIEEVERLADWIGFIDGGRLVFAEPVSSLLDRFRLIEVIASDEPPTMPADAPDWLLQGTAGRTLRFVETNYDPHESIARITSTFSGADVRAAPLSLRDIFVTLARRRSSASGASGASA